MITKRLNKRPLLDFINQGPLHTNKKKFKRKIVESSIGEALEDFNGNGPAGPTESKGVVPL